MFATNDASKFENGRNLASNRLRNLNNIIKLWDLHGSLSSFKVKMKHKFLQSINNWKDNIDKDVKLNQC